MAKKPTYEQLEQRVKDLEKEVSKYKMTYEALRESEERFNLLFNNMSIGVALVDKDGYVLTANEADCRFLGYSQEEIKGMHFTEFTYPEDFDLDINLFKDLIKGNRNSYAIDKRYLRKDNKIVWGRLNVSMVKSDAGDPLYTVISCEDIEKSKQVEEALRESEENYRTLFETMIQGVVYQDAEGNITDANPSAQRILGFSLDQMQDRTSVDPRWKSIHEDGSHFPGETHPSMVALKTGKRIENVVMGIFNPVTEDYTWININAVPQFKEGVKKPYQVYTTFHDITERKQTEEALRESEEKYRLLFETESDVIMLLRKGDGKILEINRAGPLLYGYSREELLNLKDTDLSAEPKETRKAVLEDIEKIPIRYHRNKDGTVFPVEISGSRILWKGEEARIATIRDISDRIEAEKEKTEFEAQLRQMQKMEAIGTLAGGIAHDFNNILTPFIAHTEIAMMDIPKDYPAQNNLKEALKAGYRARDLVKQILAFGRQQGRDVNPIKVSIILKEALKLLRSSIPTTIDIQQKLTAKSDAILADPTQIHQIIMNLCTNAAHAMPETGGVLELRTENQMIDQHRNNAVSDLTPGEYLKLTISDTGHGMDQAILNRIFEPYYTTKDKQRGTGLGLSVVHGIVKSLNGEITVDSKPGEGSIFNVYLPLCVDEEIVRAEPITAEKIPVGTERILLVDDEKVLVDTVQSMIERLGYQVTIRTSSIEALEAFKHKPDAFDLIITDQTMPNMTGKDLAKKIMSIRPDIPIILCTGFSEQIDADTAKEMGISAFVLKPIVMQMIAHTIREVLDKK